MARDPGRRLGRPDSGSSPVDQLEVWRNWRHDTVEFPAVPVDDEVRVGRTRGSRSRVGVLVAATLLLGALVLSGLTALGVGPVARLVGTGDDAGARHGGATPSPSTAQTASSGGSNGSRAATSSAATPSAATASAATASAANRASPPAGSVPSAAGPAAGPLGAGATPGRPGPAGRRGAPPQPPVGGPAG